MIDHRRLERLTHLPVDPDLLWQGECLSAQGPDSGPRSNVSLWISLDPVVIGKPVIGAEHQPLRDVVLEALLNLAFDPNGTGHLPGVIQVAHEDWAQWLGEYLPGVSIEIHKPLAPLQDMLDEIVSMLRNQPPTPPRWSIDTLQPRDLLSWLRAAEHFETSECWKELTEYDVLSIETPTPPADMAHAVLLRSREGHTLINFYARFESHFEDPQSRMTAAPTDGIWQIVWLPIESLSADDLDSLHAVGIVAMEGDWFPCLQRTRDEQLELPTLEQFRFATGLLAALGDASAKQFDIGRWEWHPTDQNQSTWRLSLPDVLAKTGSDEWQARGVDLDSRWHEMVIEDLTANLQQQNSRTDEVNTANDSQQNAAREHASRLYREALGCWGRRRRLLANQALAQDDRSVEVLGLLGELTSDVDESHGWFLQAVSAARHQLPPQPDDLGWQDRSLRPFLRALYGLAVTSLERSQDEEALAAFQELLLWDRTDTLGARYGLLAMLLTRTTDQKVAQFLAEYNETSVQWSYARTVLAYRISGDSTASRTVAQQALLENRWVVPLITATIPIPSSDIGPPDSPEQALACIQDLGEAIVETDGLLPWLIKLQNEWQTTLDQ